MFVLSLLSNLVSAFIWFLLGYFWKWIIWISPDRYRFSKVFGKKFIKGINSYIVTDIFFDNRPNTEFRYIKEFPGREVIQINGPQGFMGAYMARTINYLSSFLSRYCDRQLSIDTDLVLFNRWDGTFICLGGPGSNIKTREIMELEINTYVNFIKNNSAIRNLKTGKEYTIQNNPPRDYGIVLKLKNTIFTDHNLFICAGLGEFGTSGAAYYLSRYWRDLYNRYKDKQFVIVVEVRMGSDESARVVEYIENDEQMSR